MESVIIRSGHIARQRHPISMQNFRDCTHPFKQGALVDKDDIRAIEQPASVELRTTLETTFWLQKALADTPHSHSSHQVLEERLRSEPASPSSSSTRSLPVFQERRRPYSFVDLPLEVRRTIYEYSLTEQEPVSPVLDSCNQSRWAERQVKTSGAGLPVLEQVFPALKHELRTMLATFYRSNTFQFDLRSDTGLALLRRWADEKREEASVAKKVRIKHWTFWYNESGDWEHTADETILALMPTGCVEMKRLAQLSRACSCGVEDFMSSHCPGWKLNKICSLTDFVKAIRIQEEEVLIEAVANFVKLVQQHNDSFHLRRENPKPCQQCGRQMMLLRSSTAT